MSASKEVLWSRVSRSEQTVALDAASFCSAKSIPSVGPLDDLLSYFRSVLPLGIPSTLENNEVLGRVLLLGLVSGVETYFRTVLARLIVLCPVCRAVASQQQLSLESIDYYGIEGLGYGLLEGVSFVSDGEVLKQTKRLTGIAWDQDKSSIGIALKQFEALSVLRHAAVHARGSLSVRNLRALDMRSDSQQSLVIKFPQIQTAAEICLNAARAYNRYMFEELVQRWINKKLLSGNWEKDSDLLSRSYNLFIAREDRLGGKRYKRFLYTHLRPNIAAALAKMP